MEFLLLTNEPELPTPRRLAAAARALGATVTLVRPRDPPPRARLAGARLLARPGTFSRPAVLRAWRTLVTAGALPLQTRRALSVAGDQWLTLVAAARAGIACPPTRLIRRPGELPAALAELSGRSWFVKGRRGSQGTHVVRVADCPEALHVGHLFWGSGQSFLLQADRSDRGPIERHLVVAGRVIASARAIPAPGEYRSNAHRGGRFEPRPLAATSAGALAVAAVAAVGLPFAAVDAIGGERPELLEVNASPGLEALEAATGRDLAGEVMAALLGAPLSESRARPFAARRADRARTNSAAGST
ncbi:MAG: hypothetical protein JNL90_07760 [Planctomycetes bacterium]|nr:hypothetical protein [Planctomycetota bacterium]